MFDRGLNTSMQDISKTYAWVKESIEHSLWLLSVLLKNFVGLHLCIAFVCYISTLL